MSNEANTCRKYVEPKLESAGWGGQRHDYIEQYYFTDGKLQPRNQRRPRGVRKFADYLLLYNGDFPLAVVEAKRKHKTPDDGLDQAREYARILGVKFAYSTNGEGIVEYDFTTGLQSEVQNTFPQPDELWARLKASQGLNEDAIAIRLPTAFDAVADKLLTPFNLNNGKKPRYYQRIAIDRSVEAILRGRKRLLLTMATGTGKTSVAFQLCWKLYTVGWNAAGEHRPPRILFLADRNVLVDDPMTKDFAAFSEDKIHKIQGTATKGREIHFAIYQAIAEDTLRPGLYREYSPDYFDLIVVDECHWGSARDESNWRVILEYFQPSYQLGLTATPNRQENAKTRQDVIAKVFRDVNNRMTSGALLRDVVNKVNEIHFDKTEEVHILSRFYEGMLKEMRDSAGDWEFYTPRPVVRFMVQVTDPQLGEMVLDPACGTGGFLVETYDYLKPRCSAQDRKVLQSSIAGGEAKSLPLMLAHMNLVLHGFEYPDVDDKNSLRFSIAEMDERDWVDVVLTNPPFGGEEEDSIQKNFPPERKTKETALLFLQLIMRRLSQKAKKPGRAAVVFPNGVLFGDGVCGRLKEDLLKDYNLHTIVRLPNGTFAPYTGIPTNLLFFDRSGPTEEIWYYEIPLPEGRKTFTKTKPIQDSDFEGCCAWWKNRVENEQAWKYEFRDAYYKALKAAQPHWDAARAAEEKANDCVKSIKELESKIQNLQATILDFAPAKERKVIEQQVRDLRAKVQGLRQQEQQQRELAKEEQAKGDGIYWPIYNLDQKNPSSQSDFEHLPPEQLLADIAKKDQRVAELMAEIQAILQQKVEGE
jgi:type I restriction enzyme M protein